MRNQCAKTCGFCGNNENQVPSPDVGGSKVPVQEPVVKAPPAAPPVAPPTPTDGCFDKVKTCPTWADAGECERNAGYMKENCPKSCNLCPPAAPPPGRATSRVSGHVQASAGYGRDEPEARGIHYEQQMPDKKKELEQQVDTAVPKNYKPKSHIKFSEANSAYNTNCKHAAERGQCHSHSMYMSAHCPQACNSTQLDTETQMPLCKDFNVKTC